MKPRARAAVKPHANAKPFFRASLTPSGEFEILIYEEIGEYFDWDTYSMAGTTAKSVRASLDAAGQISSITLRINSPGGDAFEGVAIGNVLKATGKPINVFIDGIAASAASIVAMCGTTRVMASNAMMMIHKAWTVAVGNADDMRKMAGTLDAIDAGAVAQTYCDATGKPMDEILQMMKSESWLSARDCVSMGFATALAPDADESAMALARNFKTLLRTPVPQEIKDAPRKPANLAPRNDDLDDSAAGCACDCQACMDGDCAACSNANCEDPNCEGCPMQAETENSAPIQTSNLNVFQAIQHRIDTRNKKAAPAIAA